MKTDNYFPIKEVKLIGAQHLDHEEIQRLLMPLVHKGFFAVQVNLIKERLIEFPWVSDASVRRTWPNQIVIQVVEKKPLAVWNNTQLLSANGELFSPSKVSYPQGLPEFLAPEGEQLHLLKYAAQVNQILLPLHTTIMQLELTPGNFYHIILSNGIKLTLGGKDSLTRVNDFVKVYPKIIGNRASEVNYVDLRYANGLAVRWKAPT